MYVRDMWQNVMRADQITVDDKCRFKEADASRGATLENYLKGRKFLSLIQHSSRRKFQACMPYGQS